jgi:hypothetical protein
MALGRKSTPAITQVDRIIRDMRSGMLRSELLTIAWEAASLAHDRPVSLTGTIKVSRADGRRTDTIFLRKAHAEEVRRGETAHG